MTLELLPVSAQLTQLRGDGHPHTFQPRHPGNIFSVNSQDFPGKICQVAQGMCHLLKDDELRPKLLSLVRSRQFQTRSEGKVKKIGQISLFPPVSSSGAPHSHPGPLCLSDPKPCLPLPPTPPALSVSE